MEITGLPPGLKGEEFACIAGAKGDAGSVPFLGWEDLLEEEMAAHSRILPEESHGQRSLEGYSP